MRIIKCYSNDTTQTKESNDNSKWGIGSTGEVTTNEQTSLVEQYKLTLNRANHRELALAPTRMFLWGIGSTLGKVL